MPKVKENRIRSTQIKFRLTPHEKAILEHDARTSNLTMNDYIIQTLINRKGLSAIICERRYCGNSFDISFMLGNQRVGYASCLYFENLGKVQISSFFVIKPFQNFGVEEKLLDEIYDYAKQNFAESIVAYPGPEPYCPTEWKPMDIQTAWYEAQGFHVDHMINNVVPCMIKNLPQEASI